mmetsp:Transcript_6883/g.15713  ORF Transcript_6883/g.15713 Transcript_6883/m.15713 type:complete len:916 (-) Transcript_6883:103-2850(-)
MASVTVIGIAGILLLVTPAAAFGTPRRHTLLTSIIRPPPSYALTSSVILYATTDTGSDDEKDSNSTSWANSAYSGLSNAWGYSRSVVNDRQRRRYERRRIRHRLKLDGMVEGKQPPTWAEKLVRMNGKIGAADAFMGIVNKGGDPDGDGVDGESGGESMSSATTFDDDEMDEDGYWGMLGGKKRGFISGVIRQMVRVPYRLIVGEYRRVEPGTLILVRHGESLWNANKTFTGWADPDLSPQGYREVEHAARLLVEGGYNVDIVFTSRLKRAIRSSWILLRELNEVYLPVFKSWRLNERMYGALTGLSKTETAERLGAELVQEWRGSLLSRPPALTPADKYYPGRDRRHADLSPAQIPLTESLLDCMERTRPIWLDKISYELGCGRNVLVVAHANTLRGLVKIIDDIGDDEIQDIAIPTGIPIIYNFDSNLKPIPPSSDQNTVSQVHMKGVFLEKPGLLKQAINREVEWCANVPDYEKVMSRSNNAAMTPLQSSLSKLEAEREVQNWAAQFVDETTDDEEDDGSDGKLTLVEQDTDKVWEKGLYEIEDGEYLDPDHPKFEEDVVAKESDEEEEELIAQIFDSNPCVTAIPASEVVPGIGPVPIVKNSSLIVMIRHGKTENNKLGLFTGWDDVPLATDGVVEAKEAGKLLKLHGFEFDAVYTSWLSRAIETAWYVMDEMDCLWLPIIKSWRLNERMYGELTSLSKAMVKQRHGDEQFQAWRRGYAVNPPPVSSFSPQYPGNDIRYKKYLIDIRISVSETLIRSIESKKFSVHRKLPKSESLKDCMDRTIPFFTENIMPEAIGKGKRVLIASSENAIRGLLMHLCDIPEDKIAGLEIPNGLPLIFDMNSKCIKLLDDGSGEDPLEKYNFGTSASYLFRPCKNPDGSEDVGCALNFMADTATELSASDNELIESIRKPL